MDLSLPEFYEISDDDTSPLQSPLNHMKSKVPCSMLYEIFPSLDAGQASLLLELYSSDASSVIEDLVDGSGVNASMLLRKFQDIRQTPAIQHITVRPDYIVEDSLRCFYKGNFDVSAQVEVELIGSLTTDLGGPKRQFFNDFFCASCPTN